MLVSTQNCIHYFWWTAVISKLFFDGHQRGLSLSVSFGLPWGIISQDVFNVGYTKKFYKTAKNENYLQSFTIIEKERDVGEISCIVSIVQSTMEKKGFFSKESLSFENARRTILKGGHIPGYRRNGAIQLLLVS